ncbi:hypothetical protein AB6878_12940 [Carnobacterium maltaromaticum]|uniref:hypothetical protein n=1 Tax=Carnobacterium maltaromaticum TaxID=2751 RepID=UPI0039BE5D47
MKNQSKKDSTPEEVTIQCTNCFKTNHNKSANFCSNCGEKLIPSSEELLSLILSLADQFKNLSIAFTKDIANGFKTQDEAKELFKDLSNAFRAISSDLIAEDIAKHDYAANILNVLGNITFGEND